MFNTCLKSQCCVSSLIVCTFSIYLCIVTMYHIDSFHCVRVIMICQVANSRFIRSKKKNVIGRAGQIETHIFHRGTHTYTYFCMRTVRIREQSSFLEETTMGCSFSNGFRRAFFVVASTSF